MKPRLVFILASIAMMLILPGVAFAAAAENSDAFLLKVGGTTTIAANERLETVVIIDGDAIIDGTVEGTLWIVSGNAIINGQVDGDVTVIDGSLTLGATATVDNVELIRSDLSRDPAAIVTGKLSERSEFINFGWGRQFFSLGFWLGSTLAVVITGLIFTSLASKHVTNAAGKLTERPIESVAFAILLWVGMPVVGVLAILTLIGIPLGLMLLFSLPIVWITGYTVAGMRMGQFAQRVMKLRGDPARPYRDVTIGLVLLQMAGFLPFIGGVIVGLAGFIGSGALVYLAYRSRSERRVTSLPAGHAPAAAS